MFEKRNIYDTQRGRRIVPRYKDRNMVMLGDFRLIGFLLKFKI